MRLCPVCLSDVRELIYQYRLTSGKEQEIFSCLPCGMIYSSVPKAIDYSNSIYEAPGAIGSGSSKYDRERLDQVAAEIERHCTKETVKLLDVGCGQGGLLDALERRGFGKQTGTDPSQTCCEKTAELGHSVIPGYLSDVTGKFDFITLSHVLEHIEDVHPFLRNVRDRLKTFGRVYIEVPDASRYESYSRSLPLLDFNSEHINHFTRENLVDVLDRCGLEEYGGIYKASGRKTITLTSGHLYPALWIIVNRKSSSLRVTKYINDSVQSLSNANAKLEQILGTVNDISIWGAGEYLSHVMGLPAIASRKVVQIVDRNRSLHGMTIGGCIVQKPAALDHTRPVVVAAIVAAPAIRKEAEAMGLKTITLEFK